ncbi:armadillo repeat-containing protein 4-like [Nothobranchius furzeri]|uniref:Armadillo repeat-containing protein 4-like n=3 Tax=Nothobranchius furzeri TaxID=105023 RepID=A0A9D3BXU2_NOTFU|nr:outer dynein arm-docking complex subunit 2 [Nothobranchius furzeri]KAF7225461.1 armadillo repeat-containing protein 4-like [Nothobranchius furzeri]
MLVQLTDLDWTNKRSQKLFLDTGGLQVLVNLLNLDEENCLIGSLRLLGKLCHSIHMCQAIVDLGGLRYMVENLDSGVHLIQVLAAETISKVLQFNRAREMFWKYGGIDKLVKLLKCFCSTEENPMKDVELDHNVIALLWNLSKSLKTKKAICEAGIIPLLGHLVRSPHENIRIAVMKLLQEFASEEICKSAIQTKDLMRNIIKNLQTNNEELQLCCATSIFKFVDNKETCDLVRKIQGLQALVSLLGKAENKKLLTAVTGAIWKCSASTKNVAFFQKCNTLETLVALLNAPQSDYVLFHITKALIEFVQTPENRAAVLQPEILKLIMDLPLESYEVDWALSANVAKLLGACAIDEESVATMEQFNVIHRMCVHLKFSDEDLQASSAWTLSSFLKNIKGSAGKIRNRVRFLLLIADLLKSSNNCSNIEVQASICCLVSELIKDEYNLGGLSHLGLVSSLAKLTDTNDDKVRRYVAKAIGLSCHFEQNIAAFGEAGVTVPLVNFLKESKDTSVHHYSAMALSELCGEQDNIIDMHKAGALKPLIECMKSDDEDLQMFAADCAEKIRLLVQKAEKIRKAMK